MSASVAAPRAMGPKVVRPHSHRNTLPYNIAADDFTRPVVATPWLKWLRRSSQRPWLVRHAPNMIAAMQRICLVSAHGLFWVQKQPIAETAPSCWLAKRAACSLYIECMYPRFIAALLSVATFVLLLVGGVVHATGSSLACPDWPLCHGQAFPLMQGGVLYEHGHRLLAGAVALLTASFLAAVWPCGNRLRAFGALGLALVLIQALLGGLTVVLRLPPAVSIAHLGTSMAFFAWTLCANVVVRETRAAPLSLSCTQQRLVFWASIGVYSQLLLGAVVRHRAASMSCGYDALWCAGQLWPQSGLQWLQTAHRLWGIIVAGLVVQSTLPVLRQARLHGRVWLRRLGLATHLLVLLQIAMGILVVKTGVQLHVVTTHLGLGALLWGSMVALYLHAGGLPQALPDDQVNRPPVGTVTPLAPETAGVC